MAIQAQRFVTSRARWVVYGLLMVTSLYLLAFAPVKTYFDQRAQMSAAEERYQLIAAANKELQQRAAQLQTDAEIARIAREQYELVPAGSEAYAVMPPSPDAARAAGAAPPLQPEPKGVAKIVESLKFWD